MLHRTAKALLVCALLVWPGGCADAPKKDEPKTVAQAVEEVRKEEQSARKPETPAEPAPKKDWTQQLKEDWGGLGHNLKEDIAGLWAKDNILCNLLILGGAGGLVAVSVNEWDHRVARHFSVHNDLGDWDDVGDVIGNPGTHWAVAGLFYAHSKLV